MVVPSRASLLRLGSGVLVVLAVFGALEWHKYPHGRMHVYFFDIGQGDSILIVTPSGRQIIVDGGPDASLLTRLGQTIPFFDRSIDLLVMTHPQMDHMASFPEILRRYDVEAVLMTGVAYDLPRYGEFLELLEKEDARVLIADPKQDIEFADGTRLDILWPPPGLVGKSVKEVNDTAIVFRLESRGKTVLFTGDIELPAEKALLETKQNLKADVLKVAHHGSKTSTATGFLLAVDPDLAVISVGLVNHYGHPHPVVMERLRHFGVPVRTTATEGTIELSW